MAYEFDGKKYQKASSHQRTWGHRLIAELDLRGNEKILDLGCGDGSLSARIAERLPRGEVVGIDGSRGMIAAALPKSRQNLHFLLMDINHLNFVEKFDVVFSNAALHWVHDHRKLFAHVRRVLRADGRVRFNFAGDGNCSHFFNVVRRAMARESYAGYFHDFQWPWYMPGFAIAVCSTSCQG